MSLQTYNAHPGMRWSTLVDVLTSPKHLRHRMTTARERTPAMDFGVAVHIAVLEPSRFDAEALDVPDAYVTASGELSTAKAAREWVAKLPPETLLVTERQRDACLRIRDAIDAHPDAREWLWHSDIREREVYWTESVRAVEDKAVEVKCKAKPDAIAPRLGLLWDLKTISNRGKGMSLRHCEAEIVARHYYAQLGWYARGMATDPTLPTIRDHGWIFVESCAPFDVAVLQADADMIQAGAEVAQEALDKYADALATGRWYGVAPTVCRVSLPAWMLAESGDVAEALELTGFDEEAA